MCGANAIKVMILSCERRLKKGTKGVLRWSGSKCMGAGQVDMKDCCCRS